MFCCSSKADDAQPPGKRQEKKDETEEVMADLGEVDKDQYKRPPSQVEASSTHTGEGLDWLNLVIKKAWPKFRVAANNEVKRMAAEVFQDVLMKMPASVDVKVWLDKFDFGHIAPTILSTFAEARGVDIDTQGHVDVCMGLKYSGKEHFDCRIKVAGKVAGVQMSEEFAIEYMELQALISASLGPFVESMPVFGGVGLHLMDMPRIAMSFTAMSKLGHMLGPALRFACREVITKVCLSFMRPGRETYFPLTGLPASVRSAFACPMPIGYLRVNVLQARGFPEPKPVLGSSTLGKALAPSCQIEVELGQRKFRTVNVKHTEPTWKPTYAGFLPVHSVNQLIHIQGLDDSLWEEDELFGRIRTLTVLEFLSLCGNLSPAWFTLESPTPSKAATSKIEVELSAEYLDVIPLPADAVQMAKLPKTGPSPQGGPRELSVDYVTLRRLVSVNLVGLYGGDADVPLITGAQAVVTITHKDPPEGWEGAKKQEEEPSFMMGILQSVSKHLEIFHTELPQPKTFTSNKAQAWVPSVPNVSPELQKFVAKLNTEKGLSVSELAKFADLTPGQVKDILLQNSDMQASFCWSCSTQAEYPSALVDIEVISSRGDSLGKISLDLADVEKEKRNTSPQRRMKLPGTEIWLRFAVEVEGFARKDLTQGQTSFRTPFP